ncbi:MAG: DUF4301 family protein [Flavobacteriales bacterium]
MEASKGSLFELSLEECLARLTQEHNSLRVDRPCTLGDGVELWSDQELESHLQSYQDCPPSPGELGLWVPASGAATRMFAFLDSDPQAQRRLWDEANDLAFGSAWMKSLGVDDWRQGSVPIPEAVKALWRLMKKGQIPKGLVPFHRLDDSDGPSVETAFQAHLRSWRQVMPNGGDVWFTVQESHREEIQKHLAPVAESGKFRVHFPVQFPETDTPVLDSQGGWLRTPEGDVFRRPGGHGALLPVLEQVTAKTVVIRNIDNAPSPSCTPERVRWSQAMVAAARTWDIERHHFQEVVKGTGVVSTELLRWLADSGSGIETEASPENVSPARALGLLDRPMRLVGVVRNEGQPGGGPFWVTVGEGVDQGLTKPQIVESIEFTDANKDILGKATHFNPVELVCILNPGQPLGAYVDKSRSLKATKIVQGQSCRVLEHPGLWNGAMSGWLTRFVEIPASCFQPVKSALDLIGRH